MLAIMTTFLPFQQVVPLHGAAQLFSNGTRSWLLRKHVRKDLLLPFLLGIPIGIVPSIWLIREFQDESIPLFLVATLIMYALFRPKKFPPLKIPGRYFAILGVVVAFLGLFVGATGPFLAPFFIRDDLAKEQVVSTKAALQFCIHLVKIPSFLYLGFPYLDYWPQILALTVAAWVGTKYGVRLLHKIEQQLFEKLFKFFLFIAGLRLYFKVFFMN